MFAVVVELNCNESELAIFEELLCQAWKNKYWEELDRIIETYICETMGRFLPR